MKKLALAALFASIAISATACASGCKINDCGEKIYKEGLCEVHYSAIYKKEESTTMTESVVAESAKEESIEEQKLTTPFSGNLENEISEGITPADYILPESNIRNYTSEELSVLTDEELRLARNEIYARHGRIFTADDLKSYFSGKKWYVPQYEAQDFDEKGDSVLNQFEIVNRNLIIQLEGGDLENSAHNNSISNGNTAKNEMKYTFQGEPCIEVSNIQMKDGVCYLTGNYADMVENEEEMEFHYDIITKEQNVTVVIDNSTKFKDDYISNIDELYQNVKAQLTYYSNSFVLLELEGEHAKVVRGTTCSP